MRETRRSATLGAALLTAASGTITVASAQEGGGSEAAEESAAADGWLDGWNGKAGLGASVATGNTESNSVNGTLRLERSAGSWEHRVFAGVFRQTSTQVVEREDENGVIVRSTREVDDADRFSIGYQPRFYFRESTYAFGVLEYERDEPSNTASSFKQIIGVGRQFFDNDAGSLSAEVGVGNKRTERVVGEDIEGVIGYAGASYVHDLSDTLDFSADLRSDFGGDNTFVGLELGLTAVLGEGLSANVTHATRYNSDLTDDDGPLSSDTDTLMTFNLVLDI